MATEPQVKHIVPDSGMGLYVHVPFCATKCPYCDFNTYQGIEHLLDSYLEALTTELDLWGRALGKPLVNTIFLGGGTPSYLPGQYLQHILATAQAAFNIQAEAETTAEANPDDLDGPKCQSLLELGVNRLSIGIQSLDDELLKVLGRRHNSQQAITAVREAQKAGFSNVNLDLMYGLPGQSLARWQDTLLRTVALGPSHLSLYALTPEEGTPLHRWIERGEVTEPDPDLAADMYDWARETLQSAGYLHYEISNWARPGRHGLHNLGYWRNLPYLGVGPGAHSRLGDYRFWQETSPRSYIEKVRQWNNGTQQQISELNEDVLRATSPVNGWEHITPSLACSETMILGLRLLDGMDLAEASARLDTDLASVYQSQLQELTALGLLERLDGKVRLVSSAYLIANQAFTRFVA